MCGRDPLTAFGSERFSGSRLGTLIGTGSSPSIGVGEILVLLSLE